MAIGGGTNAVIHLLALAGRVRCPARRSTGSTSSSRRTPLIANVRPSGEHLVEHLHRAGGVPALLQELEPLLHGDALTDHRTPARRRTTRGAEVHDRDVIATLDAPSQPSAGLAVLRGSLAPNGAVIKRALPPRRLLRAPRSARSCSRTCTTWPRASTTRPSPSRADSVLVLRNSGPKGGPGMPEWGQLADPEQAARAGCDATWSASPMHA